MSGNNRESTAIEPTLSVSMKKWLASLSMLVFLFAIVLAISVPRVVKKLIRIEISTSYHLLSVP